MPIAENYKRQRDELEELIMRLDNDVAYRLDALQAHYREYAGSILALSEPGDRKYILGRIKDVFRSYGLIR